jgi:hypothetical protein
MTIASDNLNSKTTKTVKHDVINKLELPEIYNDTKVVILPKDPACVYAYWEISKETVKDLLKQHIGKIDLSYVVLRVYDITDIGFKSKNAGKYFDIKTTPNTLSWYINVGEYNRSWCIDVGHIIKDEDNDYYLTVARSNPLTLPKCDVSNITSLGKIAMSSYNVVDFMKQYYEKFTKIKSSRNCISTKASSKK